MSDLQGITEAFEKALEARGWHREGQFMYAPQRTMWFTDFESWLENVADFLLRMEARRDRLVMKSAHRDPQQHKNAVEDTQGLISAIKEILTPNHNSSLA